LLCSNCGADNRPSSKFCAECGAVLPARCPNCASLVRPNAKFCDECGIALISGAVPAGRLAHAVHDANGTTAERRLVSVLFADLVGFTLFIRAGVVSFLEGYTHGDVAWPEGLMEDWLIVDAAEAQHQKVK